MNLKIIVQFKQTFQVYPESEIVLNGGILFFILQTHVIASLQHAHFWSTKFTLKTSDNESQPSQEDFSQATLTLDAIMVWLGEKLGCYEAYCTQFYSPNGPNREVKQEQNTFFTNMLRDHFFLPSQSAKIQTLTNTGTLLNLSMPVSSSKNMNITCVTC